MTLTSLRWLWLNRIAASAVSIVEATREATARIAAILAYCRDSRVGRRAARCAVRLFSSMLFVPEHLTEKTLPVQATGHARDAVRQDKW